LTVEEHSDDTDDSEADRLDDSDQEDPPPSDLEGDTFDAEDAAFVLDEHGASLGDSEEEGWYTDRESDGMDNALADDGECIEDESALGYEMS
jgi:hypothetical protein